MVQGLWHGQSLWQQRNGVHDQRSFAHLPLKVRSGCVIF
jgi:hypothetical protein